MEKSDQKFQSKVARDSEKRRSKSSSMQGRYSSYINKILKNTDSGMTISSKAMNIMNSFVMDNFTRICEEAVVLCKRNKTKTLTAREIATAVRLVFPGDLARMACAEGGKAVQNYAAKSK